MWLMMTIVWWPAEEVSSSDSLGLKGDLKKPFKSISLPSGGTTGEI